MPKMIQIRNVPDDLHRRLKARAAEQGLSLSDYLLREIGQLADRPTVEELVERLRRRKPTRVPEGAETSAQIVRRWRDQM